MKIKSKLTIMVFIPVCLSLIASITLYWTNGEMARSARMDRFANEIAGSIFELNLAADQYLLHPEERPKAQFQSAYKVLGAKLAIVMGATRREEDIIGDIRENYEGIGLFFPLLVSVQQKPGMEREIEHEGSTELRERIIGQFLGDLRQIVSHTHELSRISGANLDAIQQWAACFIFGAILISAMGMVLFSFLIGRSILRPIRLLQEGTQAISEGNLNHSIVIDSKDEVGQLSRAFGEMTSRLKTSYASVDDLKRAEEATREAHERSAWLARFPEENPNPVVRVSTDGHVLYCNPSAAALPGWTCAVGQPLDNRVLPLVSQAVLEGREQQQDIQIGERSYFVWAAPFPGENYVNIYGRDITKRKGAEEALRESEKRFRALVAASSEVLYRMSPDWSEMRQLDSRDFLADAERPSRTWLQEYIHPDDQPHVIAAVNEAIRTKSVFALEHRVRRADGSLGWTSSRAIPVLDAKGEIVEWFGTASDITERKRMENELLKSRDELEMRVQARTEALRVVNEELRTENEERQRVEIELRESEDRLRDLSTALLSAQERERNLIAQEIHDSMGASLAAAKFKVEGVLQEMGGNSEVRADLESIVPILQGMIEEARRIQMSLRPSILDDLGILTTIGWFCRQFQSTYPHIRIKQEIDIQEQDVPESLKIIIYRVLQEALNNVAKHSKASVVLLCLRKAENAIQLAIRDSGQGFDLEEAYSRKGAAKGLGLDSMRERAELSGGSFSIESCKGAGTAIRAIWLLKS